MNTPAPGAEIERLARDARRDTLNIQRLAEIIGGASDAVINYAHIVMIATELHNRGLALRSDVLEEAAKVAERQLTYLRSMHKTMLAINAAPRVLQIAEVRVRDAEETAAAIRALGRTEEG